MPLAISRTSAPLSQPIIFFPYRSPKTFFQMALVLTINLILLINSKFSYIVLCIIEINLLLIEIFNKFFKLFKYLAFAASHGPTINPLNFGKLKLTFERFRPFQDDRRPEMKLFFYLLKLGNLVKAFLYNSVGVNLQKICRQNLLKLFKNFYIFLIVVIASSVFDIAMTLSKLAIIRL